MVPLATKLDRHPLAGAEMVRREGRNPLGCEEVGRNQDGHGCSIEGQGREDRDRTCLGVGWVPGVREGPWQVAALGDG